MILDIMNITGSWSESFECVCAVLGIRKSSSRHFGRRVAGHLFCNWPSEGGDEEEGTANGWRWRRLPWWRFEIFKLKELTNRFYIEHLKSQKVQSGCKVLSTNCLCAMLKLELLWVIMGYYYSTEKTGLWGFKIA